MGLGIKLSTVGKVVDGLKCESRLVSREKQGQVNCKHRKKEKKVRVKCILIIIFWINLNGGYKTLFKP